MKKDIKQLRRLVGIKNDTCKIVAEKGFEPIEFDIQESNRKLFEK